MTSKSSVISVKIVGDADSVKRAFGQAGDAAVHAEGRFSVSMGKMDSIFAGVGMAAGNALANLPGQAIGFFGGAIDQASDLGETLSKTRTIFGESAQGLIDWADNAEKTMGMTSAAALDATGGFGNLFTQLGIGTDQARELSKSNVQLAADFASFHNADPTDVLESVAAAYRGEYDSLQKYVPLINAAMVEQRALTMTGKASADQLTAQDKALAVNALMLEGAGEAAGDFARTQDSASNKAKTASAMFSEFKTTLGEQLLPAFTAITAFLVEKGIPALEGLTPVVGTVLGAMRGLFDFLSEHKELVAGAAIGIAVVLVPAFVAWAVSAGAAAVATVIAAAPVIALGLAIGALAAGVIYAYNHFGWFRTAVDAVGGAIRWLYNWVVGNWPTLLAVITGPFGIAALVISRNWDTIKGFFTSAPGVIGNALSGLAGIITAPFRSAFNSIASMWNRTMGGLSFSVPGWVPGMGGKGFSMPRVPMLAEGAIVRGGMGGTLALIGEGANDEIVQPLPRGARAGMGGGNTINVTVVAPVGSSPRDIGRELDRYLREYQRASGAR